MNDKVEYKGYWWLPNNPDRAIAGVITYLPQESITLELIGSFEEDESPMNAFLRKKHENTIFGITSDSKKVSLLNCSAYGSLNLSCPFPIIKYTCQYLLIGDHIETLEQDRYFKAYVEFPLLSLWCPPSALTTSMTFCDTQKIETINISFNTNRDTLCSVSLDENTQLNLESGIDYDGEYYSPKIEQYTYLDIKKGGNKSISSFLKDIFIYEQFLSFATLQEIRCSNIKLFSYNECQDLKNGEKSFFPIQLMYIQSDYISPIKKQREAFLFNYESIKSKYSNIIKKWFVEKNDIAPIRQHLIDSVKYKRVFSSVDFIIIVQALEGFCSRFRKESNLTDMINLLIAEFSDIDKLQGDIINIKEVVDSRHYYSHFMDRKKKKNIIDGYELYKLTVKLKKLLVCCLLNFVGFDNNEINMILKKSNNRLFEI